MIRNFLLSGVIRFGSIILILLVCCSTGNGLAEESVVVSRAPKKQLKEILEQPLYQRWKLRQKRARQKDWEHKPLFSQETSEKIAEIMDKIGRRIKKFFKSWFKSREEDEPKDSSLGFLSLGSIVSALRTVGWVALGGLAIFLAVLLFRQLRYGKNKGTTANILSREQVREALEDGEALALDSPQWMEEAERLSRQHEFRAVYRALYLALLSGMHTAGKIDFRKNRTNHTYVRRFRGNDPERELFGQLTDLFDEVWYGFKPAVSKSISELKHDVSRLLEGEMDAQ